MSDEKEEEIYEVINISKIRSATPNLRVVNLFGINFVDDSHLELLAGNCIHLEVVALNFCLKIKGSGFKTLFQKCKKLTSLMLQHCEIQDKAMLETAWEETALTELDITSTELREDTLVELLSRIPASLEMLLLGHCEFFTDHVLDTCLKRGRLANLKVLDVSYTTGLTDRRLMRHLERFGSKLEGLGAAGKPLLAETFWVHAIPFLPNVRSLLFGTSHGWFHQMIGKVHIDQVVSQIAETCAKLERLEIQWDPESLKYSEKSGKSIDHLRIKCTRLKSITLSDCAYFEMVKSNFERAERVKIVRTTTAYVTRLVQLSKYFDELLFN